MVELVETKAVPACRETLKKITRDEIYELFLRQLMEVEKYTVKRDKLEVVYAYSPDEFTKKRIKLKLEYKEEENEIVVRGKGGINVELVVRCSREDEVVARLTVYGKAEKYVERKQVENFMKKLLELVESKAPVVVRAEIPAERLPAIPAPTPIEAAPVALEERKPDCVTRLFTAGLAVDEEISRNIPSNYHPAASTAGRLVEDGTASVDILDFSMYTTNHDIRIVCGDIFVESVRLGGEKVGVYYRNYATNEEAFGETAVEKARDRICREGVEVSYLVIELPQ
ncbi:MAG TPA: hypothetical protein EYH08_04320 [Pyrodictium sp.]|nr:hypothetical protein [Pyrodictium sp.]